MMKTVQLALSVGAMLGIVAFECAAQAASGRAALVPGAKVRIESTLPRSPRSVGTAVEIGSTAFLFQPAGGETARLVEFSALSRLEVSSGRKSNLGIGLLVGLLTGAVLGYVIYPDEGDLDLRPLGALLGGLGGGLVGAMVGANAKSERWAEIPLH